VGTAGAAARRRARAARILVEAPLPVADNTPIMRAPDPTVFLVDVDDTLLDNDRIQDDLKRHVGDQFGPECRDRFWEIQEQLFRELGYRDYLGALQRFRVEFPYAAHLVTAANFLLDYPFTDRLYPGALDALAKLHGWGRVVILTHGDVVFQPRKVQRSGIYEAVGGHVLVYVHKEQALADVERRDPAGHYVLVDDKLRILAAVKDAWKGRVTTVFVRQGKFANDPQVVASYPPADRSIERIADLLGHGFAAFIAVASPKLSGENPRANTAEGRQQ
jgi:FMN phosphatase YigB (HAD superfamily)